MANKVPAPIGQRFGMLLVLEEGTKEITRDGNIYRTINCKCDCGKVVSMRLYNILYLHHKSCGCIGMKSIAKQAELALIKRNHIKKTKEKIWPDRCLVLIGLIEHGLITGRLNKTWYSRMSQLTTQYLNQK